MYVEQPWHLSAALVARLVTLSARLDLAPGPGGSRGSDFAATRALYEPEVGGALAGPWAQAMLMALYPSSQIVGHRDPPIRGIRYHVPLVVNADCWVFHAGVWQQLCEGHCYQMNPAEPHGAVNWGTTLRLHLVVDLVSKGQ